MLNWGNKKFRENHNLILPPEYEKIKQKFPEDMGLPKDAIAYSMQSENSNALLIACNVSEESSMPFDDNDKIICELHDVMGKNEGLIEVGNGVTKKGRKYVYDIIKHRMESDDGIFNGVEYTLNINVLMDKNIRFINGSFVEEGMTGMRDSIVASMYAKENNMSLTDVMKKWAKDPYDSEYKKGFLMNGSEKAELDKYFPNHPLSMARALVKFIEENN